MHIEHDAPSDAHICTHANKTTSNSAAQTQPIQNYMKSILVGTDWLELKVSCVLCASSLVPRDERRGAAAGGDSNSHESAMLFCYHLLISIRRLLCILMGVPG